MRDVIGSTPTLPFPPCRSGAKPTKSRTCAKALTDASSSSARRLHCHLLGLSRSALAILLMVAFVSFGETIGLRSSSTAFVASVQAPEGSVSLDMVLAQAEARRADA